MRLAPAIHPCRSSAPPFCEEGQACTEFSRDFHGLFRYSCPSAVNPLLCPLSSACRRPLLLSLETRVFWLLPSAGAKVTVSCQVSAQGTPYKVTTCSVLSKEKVPVCVRLSCTPNFKTPCNGSPCAWSVNRDCSSPWPLYPSAQSQWGFGFMTLQGGPPNVKVLGYRPAIGGQSYPRASPCSGFRYESQRLTWGAAGCAPQLSRVCPLP